MRLLATVKPRSEIAATCKASRKRLSRKATSALQNEHHTKRRGAQQSIEHTKPYLTRGSTSNNSHIMRRREGSTANSNDIEKYLKSNIKLVMQKHKRCDDARVSV